MDNPWSQSESSRMPDDLAIPAQSNRQLSPQPDPTTAPHPAFSSQRTHLHEHSSIHAPRLSAAPAPSHLGPSRSHQFDDDAESSTDPQHRFSVADKGKQPAYLHVPISEDELMSDDGDMFGGSTTPTPHAATEVLFSFG